MHLASQLLSLDWGFLVYFKLELFQIDAFSLIDLANLKQLLFEILFIKLSKLPETKLAEVGEEDPALLLHLTLHVHHLLLGRRKAQRFHCSKQILNKTGSRHFVRKTFITRIYR